LRLRKGRHTLSPAERIKDREDFSRTFKAGRRIRTPGFTIVFAPNGLGYSRIGISVGKRFGRAVQRNRAKRIFRELFRLNKDQLPKGVDYIFMPGPKLHESGWTELQRELRAATGRIKRLVAQERSPEEDSRK
jgi:ribonuclease P protein component